MCFVSVCHRELIRVKDKEATHMLSLFIFLNGIRKPIFVVVNALVVLLFICVCVRLCVCVHILLWWGEVRVMQLCVCIQTITFFLGEPIFLVGKYFTSEEVQCEL